jgi:hypothetical protein
MRRSASATYRLDMTRQFHMIVNPSDDEAFVALVDRLAGPGGTAADLVAALRTSNPLAAVHVRDLSGEQATVWYVYRDGRWRRPGTAA